MLIFLAFIVIFVYLAFFNFNIQAAYDYAAVSVQGFLSYLKL